jgi:TonB family protein
MRSALGRIGLLSAAIVLAACTVVSAQQGLTDEGKRKIRTKVIPAHPGLAQRMRIFGKVKIEVLIAPDGHVKSARVIGGHPVLAQAAQEAAKEWKFYPGSEETTQIIEFDFHAPDS